MNNLNVKVSPQTNMLDDKPVTRIQNRPYVDVLNHRHAQPLHEDKPTPLTGPAHMNLVTQIII